LQYFALYIKNLLLSKKYDEAENQIGSYESKAGSSYLRAQSEIFKGILQEKKYHNYVEARRLYNAGLSDISVFGYYGNEYSAYAYFGLSRISDIEKDKYNKKLFRKKALDLTSYKKVNFDD
jgi:hypothetical protein